MGQWTGGDACERVCPRMGLYEEKHICMMIRDGSRW